MLRSKIQSAHSMLVCHISYCKLQGQYFQPTIKLIDGGKYGLGLGGGQTCSAKTSFYSGFAGILETAEYTTATSRQKNRYIYRLCTHQRCHNNQGNSTEIHEDEKLSSHQAFRSDDTTTSKLYRRQLVSYHVQGVKDYSTFH